MPYGYALIAMRTPTSGRALLREVRASFYRKLFIAFVVAAVLPVLALAFGTREYIANLINLDVESEATRTAASASRVVEDVGRLEARGGSNLEIVDDNLVVWLSRVIAQDVNIFDGAGLLASSERNLFASGLLPTRTPGEVYRAIVLEGRPSFVYRETVAGYPYLVSAAPVRVQNHDAILTYRSRSGSRNSKPRPTSSIGRSCSPPCSSSSSVPASAIGWPSESPTRSIS